MGKATQVSAASSDSRPFHSKGGAAIAALKVRYQNSKYLLLLLLPGFVYFVIFQYLPMYGVTIAFKDYNSYQGILRSPWIGFDSFVRFFSYPHFWRIIRNTFLLSFLSMIFGFPAPIIFALLLNEVFSQKYKRTVQTISFLPHFISLPAVIGMMFLLLSPRTGLVNALLGRLGIEPIYFMMKQEWFRPLYIISGIWQGLGWGSIIYLAQLSRVDPQLFDAATIDGASRLRKIWHINLPCLRPVISILLILRMGSLLSVGSEKVILMYNPYTYETADVIGSFVYRRGLLMADFSFGAAVGLLGSIVGLILVVIANQTAKRVSEYTVW